jgi:RHS repeat-associated protein
MSIIKSDPRPPRNDEWGPHFIHTDHLGSTNVVTNSAGHVEQETYYHPYGAVRPNEGLDGSFDFMFTGQEYDEECGLNYYGARYYNSQAGRFISPDPAGPDYSDPQTLNRYAYTRNNRVNFVDPTGLFFDILLDIGFIGWDVYDIITDPSNRRGHVGSLGLDVAAALIPGVTGLGRGAKLAGQWHHVISNPIAKALADHTTLAGKFVARDPRYIAQAIDKRPILVIKNGTEQWTKRWLNGYG